MTGSAEVTVELANVLNDLGFVQTSSGYRFEIDGVEFDVVWDGLGRYCLMGSVVGPRTASFVEYFMPRKVASHEQGVALLAYALRNISFKNPPAWLVEGNALGHTLPWSAQR
ncbi:protein of unknown function [Candidatus Filomicrobium marinum]|uniref:Uncharacterized protein n=1 Tax=Candidatus Filomicrobium marinum TaxID=1608628 RepID=A0A0D6JDZ5_9HYPH|nr:hypothetical protein [Candidatus Filomicrobium marinum]CFX18425.1 protein of unknown function [Candidatus Filomicrobium marinum]CPR18373.1 protein of unknown function [Candidatus Filomicrobium marinum]